MTDDGIRPSGTERVRIGQAKGRPMLSWVGKRPLREVRAFPAQLVERFAPEAPAGAVSQAVDWSDWPERFDRGGLLFHGDNKEVLAHLLANGFRGKVDLVYIDPPFDSGADYVRKVQLRGASGSARLDGETYTLGEQIQYTDIWANDTYLQFMYERLLLLKELASPTGSLWLHCDSRRSHQLRLLLDEVFGADSFRNQVTWRRKGGSALSGMSRMSTSTDTLILYARSEQSVFNVVHMQPASAYVAEMFTHQEPDGRRFMLTVMSSPTYRPNLVYDYKGYGTPANGWRYSRQKMEELDKAGYLFFPADNSKQIYKKIYLDEYEGQPVNDLWTDISLLKGKSAELLDYPTQKPEALLARVLAISSNPGDIVLDCFMGSGTTAAVAQKLGRRWIGADINKGAIQTTEKRLAAIIGEQIEAGASEQLTVETGDGIAKPSQLSFTVHRVNEYDLQIQHNEALELAVEHLGVQRTRTDPFFHGTLGRELVYIVPFDHPATVLDLQAVARELEARPQEERDVVVVGLGRELSTQAWLDDHNRHRPVNKLRLVDLRTDPKHGRFFEHRPAQARVSFERADGCLRVRVDDFISPSIIERLAGQEGVLSPQVTDWRAMADSVAIDAAYDGEVFDVDLIDVPERRSDLVAGRYELPAPDGDRPAAVRITDMLGEEVLVVEERP